MSDKYVVATKHGGWAIHLGGCLAPAVVLAACSTPPTKQADRLNADAEPNPPSQAAIMDSAEPVPANRINQNDLLPATSELFDLEETVLPGAIDDTEPWLTRSQKTLLLNAGAATALTAWGIYKWDYGQVAPNATSEKWLGQQTDEGGSDKLGHFWSAYALSHMFASIYDAWDYTEDEATTYGTLSSAGFQTFMELGDSFSRFGFSYEDMIMNLSGVGAGYLLRAYPRIGEKVDLRLEYAPSLDGGYDTDVFTDYEHHKYLLALKGSGFEGMQGSFLEYLELQSGYFTRGYEDFAQGGMDTRRRTFYVGVGLNIGKVVSHIWDTPLFDYFEIPGTYIPIEVDLDQ